MIRQPPKRSTNRRKSGPQHPRNVLQVSVRSKALIRQRTRFLLTLGCKLFLVAAAIFGCWWGGRWAMNRLLWKNPEYNLAVVEINDEGQGLAREMIINTAGLRLGQNVFNFSLTKARAAVAALPQVDRVEMRRVLPNKVAIDIIERRPVAWVADAQTEDPSASEKAFLVDAKRVLFRPKRQVPEYLRLPSICGVQTENFLAGETIDSPEIRAALELIQRGGDTGRFQIRSVDISKGYCMIATDTKRAKIVFGLEKIDKQLERLAAVLDRFSNTHQDVQTVNLMVERNIPVTFAPPPEPDPETSGSATAPAVAESGAKRAIPAATPARAAEEDAPKPVKKKSAPAAETHERKKPVKRVKSAETVTVRRAEPAVRRAEPVLQTQPAPVTRAPASHSFFSFLHGQR